MEKTKEITELKNTIYQLQNEIADLIKENQSIKNRQADSKVCRSKESPCLFHEFGEPCNNCISLAEKILNKYCEKHEDTGLITANYLLIKDAIQEALDMRIINYEKL